MIKPIYWPCLFFLAWNLEQYISLAQVTSLFIVTHSSRRLEKYLNLEGFHEKSLKIKSALKSTGNH